MGTTSSSNDDVGHVIERCGALSISETPIESDNAIGLLC